MNKEEYIKKLAHGLEGCDTDETQSAIEYYTELLDEADNADEQMKSLGSPEELAKQINTQNTSNMPDQKEKGFSVGRVLALVFTSWLWLTCYSLLLCLFVIIAVVYAAFPFMAIMSLAAVPGYISYLPYVMELLTLAVICAGISVLLFRPMAFLIIKTKNLTLSFTRFLFTKPRKRAGSKKYKPMSKTPAKVSGATLAVGAVLCVITFLLHPNSSDFAKSMGLENVSYDLSEDTTSISISAKQNANVRILPSDTGSTYITVENVNTESLNVTEGDSFALSYESGINYVLNLTILNIRNQADITLYLAENTLESLDVYVSCGDLSAEGVSAKLAAFETEVGKIEIIDSSFSGIELNNACGDFSADNLSVIGGLIGTLDVGKAKLENVTAGAVVFDIDSGSFYFGGKILGTQASEITVNVGDITMRLENGSSYSILADTDVGSASINGKSPSKSELDGDTVVRVYADCGDIDIETY